MNLNLFVETNAIEFSLSRDSSLILIVKCKNLENISSLLQYYRVNQILNWYEKSYSSFSSSGMQVCKSDDEYARGARGVTQRGRWQVILLSSSCAFSSSYFCDTFPANVIYVASTSEKHLLFFNMLCSIYSWYLPEIKKNLLNVKLHLCCLLSLKNSINLIIVYSLFTMKF